MWRAEMAGGKKATPSGNFLREKVVVLAEGMGLEVKREVTVGRRIWGARRRIDVVVTQPQSRITLGLECKYQKDRGTTDEKIPATILDISAWPIPGLVVFEGKGISENIRSYLYSTGKAVEFEDLEAWMRLFFRLP
jgi:PD-(D/E)XK nuclease superfamily protein